MKSTTLAIPFESDENLPRAGQKILLSGQLYTARDAAHKRLCAVLDGNDRLPFDPFAIYYTGPSPAPPGRVIGSAGPTTSSRMDSYTLPLLKAGLRVMIGKGERSRDIYAAIERYRALYLIAAGGAGALLGSKITACSVEAYADLGPEAVYKIQVENFPAIVAVDAYGGNILTH